MIKRAIVVFAAGVLVWGWVSCSRSRPVEVSTFKFVPQGSSFRVETSQLALECNRDLGLRVFLHKQGRWVTISAESELPPVTSLRVGGHTFSSLALTQPAETSVVGREGLSTNQNESLPFGEAHRVRALGRDPSGALGVSLALDFPKRYPDVVVITSQVQNLTPQALTIEEIDQASLALSPGGAPQSASQVLFWSLQGGGYKWGGDYILPVRAGFSQDNYTGPKGDANGGGFPFVDLWRPEMGVAVALLEAKPALARVPVNVAANGQAKVSVATRPAVELPAGGTYAAPPVMVAVHEGDFYNPVVRYRQLMSSLGVAPVSDFTPADYAPAWCTWGYQRTFTVQDLDQKMVQMKTMGMSELILDDGWFTRFGDWEPTPAKFPRGEPDMKALIGRAHAQGLTFRLWWSPGSADPGSNIDKLHPDWFILDEQGRRQKASWNAYYLCPAYRPVREFTRRLVERFVKRWGVDSFKIDGVDLNHAPLCYNPAHHHARPEESFEEWPGLFREIRETARSIRPDFRIELCPCGITPTYQLGTAFEQPVTSDPFDYQVTLRVKFLKAWFGPAAPVLEEYVGLLGQKEPNGKPYTFRVELYPRAIGTGAVISTFSPVLDKSHAGWTELYNQLGLASGEYLNLYDVGWENPEGHVIRKDGRLYYAFYARVPGEEISGKITLRGLGSERYRVTDYADHRDFGVVAGPDPSLSVGFHDSLLLMVEPLAPPGKA
jgi:alpha-galactosidase